MPLLLHLHRQLAEVTSCPETHTNGHRLTEIEEKSLIKQLLDADKQGFPIQLEFLCEMAEILLHEQLHDSKAILGINWVSIFIKHHSEVCTCYN